MKKFKELIFETTVLSRSVPGILFAIFISSLIMMNVLANKSIDTHLSFLALDCGFIFSWVTFLVMDIVVKHFGLRAANTLTIIGLITNLFWVTISCTNKWILFIIWTSPESATIIFIIIYIHSCSSFIFLSDKIFSWCTTIEVKFNKNWFFTPTCI